MVISLRGGAGAGAPPINVGEIAKLFLSGINSPRATVLRWWV
jgi:hypothetical protein